MVLSAACNSKVAGGNSNDAVDSNQSTGDVITNVPPNNGGPDNAPVDDAEGTDQILASPEHLSIDVDKIDLLRDINPKTGKSDGLGMLQKKYPDLKLINTEDLGKFGKNETWQSSTSGMSYLLWIDSNENPESGVDNIAGPVSSLISGLTAPIDVDACMTLLDTPKSNWAVGKSPHIPFQDKFDNYDPNHLGVLDVSPNDLCIIIPVPDDRDFTSSDYPFGIKITMSKPGYVSPDDKLEIVWIMFGD